MENITVKYKDALTENYTKIAQDPRAIFVGYNTKIGRGGGVFRIVPVEKLYETPVAENLMAGIAIGLSIEGYKPVLYFERFNFILNALDAIVNHLDKFEKLSYGQYCPKLIIRAVIGGITTPFYTGSTHTQDFTEAIKQMVEFPVYELGYKGILPTKQYMDHVFEQAIESPQSSLIVEYKDLYEKTI